MRRVFGLAGLGVAGHPAAMTCRLSRWLAASFLLVAVPARGGETPAPDPCAQPSPPEMAAAAGVELPRYPWHLVNVWWDFEREIEHFESFSMEVTVDRDIPPTYNLYVSPCGLAKINGLQFYGGLQTNILGWASAEDHTRVCAGHGAIFSRWSADKKTPVDLGHVRTAGPDCLVESAGYEGEFASVRRPLAWGKGTWRWEVLRGETERLGDKAHTWFTCQVAAPDGAVTKVGSLRFEGDDFTWWPRHSAFVEVYSTGKVPRSNIPKVDIRFGWPRINGKPAPVKHASAFYPHTTGPAAPDCATASADGPDVKVEVGPIFVRDEARRSHPLPLTPPG